MFCTTCVTFPHSRRVLNLFFQALYRTEMGQAVDLITAPKNSVNLSKSSLARCALLLTRLGPHLTRALSSVILQAQHNQHLQVGFLLVLSASCSRAAPLWIPPREAERVRSGLPQNRAGYPPPSRRVLPGPGRLPGLLRDPRADWQGRHGHRG